jgi:16S rRNA (adenine1518-N6/adenine1519-N6)-dimethyltransferase
MSYQNKNELIALLKGNAIFAKKRLGQNFLTSRQALSRIVESADLNKEDFVIEVGPGLGILTEQLAQKAGKVTACEFDADLIPFLKKQFQLFENVEIIHEDALKLPLPAENYKLVANIPYYITSPILNHFLNPLSGNQKRPRLIVMLVQKEVAQKICVKQGDHTVLSLEVQIFGEPSITGLVPKSCFYPEPKVDSAILKIKVYERPLVDDTGLFFKTIKMAFSQRRKTLLNSLRYGLKIEKSKIAEIIKEAGIKQLARPQELSVPDWQRLIATLKNSS